MNYEIMKSCKIKNLSNASKASDSIRSGSLSTTGSGPVVDSDGVVNDDGVDAFDKFLDDFIISGNR